MSFTQGLRTIIIFKKSLIRKLLPGLLGIVLLTVVILLLHQKFQFINIKMSAAIPGYMGAALGLLLVFRNNSAYDKWWEARKEIGSLVNTSRNIVLTINGLLTPGAPAKKEISNLVIAFVNALKEHLRQGVRAEHLFALSAKDKDIVMQADHKPVMIVNILINKVEDLYKEKVVNDIQQFLLLEKVNALIDILGRCERIRNTPIPMAYGFLLKFFINIYVFFLPLGMIDEVGWYCIPMVVMLYYLLMSIVLTAEEIEEPFGVDLNDISMDQIAERIGTNVREIVTLE